MGLKTTKNFITTNAVEAITAVPSKPKKKFVDTRHGDAHNLVPSGLEPVYVHKKVVCVCVRAYACIEIIWSLQTSLHFKLNTLVLSLEHSTAYTFDNFRFICAILTYLNYTIILYKWCYLLFSDIIYNQGCILKKDTLSSIKKSNLWWICMQ